MTVKITQIEKVSRKNLYRIYENDVVLATINDFSIVHLSIKVGKEYEIEIFNEMILQAKKGECFETLLNVLGQTALTEHIAKTKLKQRGYENDAIDFAVDKAVGYGYINDKEFAESYIKYTSGKSRKRIKAELASKGVFEQTYSEALEDYDEYEACKKHISKMIKGELDDEGKRKLFSKVYMQGFPYDIIKNVYEDIIQDF